MRWLTLVATSMVLSSAAIGSAPRSDTARAVEGNWQGQLVVTPQISLRITLDVTKGTNALLSGKWSSPDEALSALPLESIVLTDDVLTFTAKPTGAIFKGKLNQTGTELAGDWTQNGKSYAIVFNRFDPSKVVVATIPPELTGIWQGKLKVTAGIELRIALNVEKDKEGTLKAILASPDQGANNIPISAIGLKDDVLSFESKIIGAKFSGKRNEEKNAFQGEFSQGGG
jgi:hypothetical protein